MRKNELNLLGQKFGMLTFVEKIYIDNRKHWKCVCDCGNEKITKTAFLRNGSVSTCGCKGTFKDKQKKAKGGFLWKYRFRENKKSITLISTDLIKLKKKVISKGYDWIIIDEEKAKQSFNENSLRNMS